MTTQAHPLSEREQLTDARTANDLLRGRLAEQEAIVAKEWARADAAERERDGRKERQFEVETAVLSAYVTAFPHYAYESTQQVMQVFLSELATLRQQLAEATEDAGIARTERDAARAEKRDPCLCCAVAPCQPECECWIDTEVAL